jgi:hypothetical protein
MRRIYRRCYPDLICSRHERATLARGACLSRLSKRSEALQESRKSDDNRFIDKPFLARAASLAVATVSQNGAGHNGNRLVTVVVTRETFWCGK